MEPKTNPSTENKSNQPAPKKPFPTVEKSKQAKKKLFLPLIIASIILIILLAIAGIFAFKNFNQPQAENQATPSASPTQEPKTTRIQINYPEDFGNWNTYQGQHYNFTQNKNYTLIFKYPAELKMPEPHGSLKLLGIYKGKKISLEIADASFYSPGTAGKFEPLLKPVRPLEKIIIDETEFTKEIFNARNGGYGVMFTSKNKFNYFLEWYTDDYSNPELIYQILSTFKFIDSDDSNIKEEINTNKSDQSSLSEISPTLTISPTPFPQITKMEVTWFVTSNSPNAGKNYYINEQGETVLNTWIQTNTYINVYGVHTPDTKHIQYRLDQGEWNGLDIYDTYNSENDFGFWSWISPSKFENPPSAGKHTLEVRVETKGGQIVSDSIEFIAP